MLQQHADCMAAHQAWQAQHAKQTQHPHHAQQQSQELWCCAVLCKLSEGINFSDGFGGCVYAGLLSCISTAYQIAGLPKRLRARSIFNAKLATHMPQSFMFC